MLTRDEIIGILKSTGVMLSGHFVLTSGRHSDKYMQCARLFESPQHSQQLSAELAARFEGDIDVVIGPALGGIILAYETARALGKRNIFAERENGVMTLRRGFALEPGERVLVVEDVVTTGGSVKEVVSLAQRMGAKVVGVGSIVDRSGGEVDFGVRFESLLQIKIDSFAPEECPLCKQGLQAIKPGSRAVV